MRYVGWWLLIFTAVLFALGANDALNYLAEHEWRAGLTR